MEKKSPLRMCIACKEMKPKKQMLRIVKSGESVISLDIKGKANGRGAYICDSAGCIDKLCKAKLINKAFKCAVSDEVYKNIKESFNAKQ